MFFEIFEAVNLSVRLNFETVQLGNLICISPGGIPSFQ